MLINFFIKSIDIEGDAKVDTKPMPSALPRTSLPVGPKRRHSILSIADAEIVIDRDDESIAKTPKSLWVVNRDSAFKTFWWFYTWPIRCLLSFAIPNPKNNRAWYPLTFILCIVFIGLNSFMIYWMVAIIGFTFGIPETIMGMTLIAWGGCMPEAIISVIMIRQGKTAPDPLGMLVITQFSFLFEGRGGIGVSQSMGANSLAILMALGIPWFVRTLVDGAGSTDASITIYSYGIEFTIISLLLATALLYVTLACTKYRLKKVVGVTLFAIYAVLITFAILVEMDIVFPSGNRC